jgi:hypothetical protein
MRNFFRISFFIAMLVGFYLSGKPVSHGLAWHESRQRVIASQDQLTTMVVDVSDDFVAEDDCDDITESISHCAPAFASTEGLCLNAPAHAALHRYEGEFNFSLDHSITFLRVFRI